MRTRKAQIQFKHGYAKDLPKRMTVGEPGYAVDTKDLYIGQGNNEKPYNITGDLKSQIQKLQKTLDDFSTEVFDADLIDSITFEKVGRIVIDKEGLRIVDNDDNIRIEIGSDFETQLEKLSVTSINWKDLGLIKATVDLPKTFYVSPNATGDGTGRNADNKADGITDVIDYIKSNGSHLTDNVTIKVESGDYINFENVVIKGLTGNGSITIDIDPSAFLRARFTVKNSTPVVYLKGGRKNHLGDVGGAIALPFKNAYKEILLVENSTVIVDGIRSKVLTEPNEYSLYTKDFATVNNGNLTVLNSDVVMFANMYDGENFVIHDNNNIGNVTRRLYGTNGVMYTGGYRVKTRSSEEVDAVSYVAITPYTSPKTSTPKGSLFVPQADISDTDTGGGETEVPPEDIPTPTPETVRKTATKTFTLTDLHTTVWGTGASTSAKTTVMGQGHWVNSSGSSYKNHTGYGTIPITSLKTFISDAIAGTVEITLTLHRQNTGHGYSGAVPIPKIKLPSGSYYNNGVGVARDKTAKIDLPVELVTSICKGETTQIKISSSKQNDYSFYDEASLTVTCTKEVTV